jgi:hypothetical protein
MADGVLALDADGGRMGFRLADRQNRAGLDPSDARLVAVAAGGEGGYVVRTLAGHADAGGGVRILALYGVDREGNRVLLGVADVGIDRDDDPLAGIAAALRQPDA